MSEEGKKTIKNVQAWIGKNLNLSDALIRLMEETPSPRVREWIKVCSLDGIGDEKIIELVHQDLSDVEALIVYRNEFLKNKYTKKRKDKNVDNISKDKEKKTKKSVFDDITIEEYDLHKNPDRIIKKYYKNLKINDEIAAVIQEKDDDNYKQEAIEVISKENNEARKTETKRAPTETDTKEAIDTYIKKVIQNNSLNKDVKIYLKQLFNKGISIKIIEKLAIEGADLDDVKKLYKILQEKENINDKKSYSFFKRIKRILN